MRGKHVAREYRYFLCGITPADAGKTLRGKRNNSQDTDHPRGCGENMSLANIGISCAGSPPRMRGKRSEVKETIRKIRITPADAGKTPYGATICPKLQDHPRGCGENIIPHSNVALLMGSPPRMRGKRFFARIRKKTPRITPADAGKTWLHFRRRP